MTDQPTERVAKLAASIMARLRGHGIIHEDFCCERQDEFEALILTPILQAELAAQQAAIVAWLNHGFPGAVPMPHLLTVATAIERGEYNEQG